MAPWRSMSKYFKARPDPEQMLCLIYRVFWGASSGSSRQRPRRRAHVRRLARDIHYYTSGADRRAVDNESSKLPKARSRAKFQCTLSTCLRVSPLLGRVRRRTVVGRAARWVMRSL
ncbi:hypothetical protein EVAR_22756_1 [Eumeta japonica]|uniref:Uncharacterized protein n=1 Tax=Eumeta variegata TaxID=151549 RepID=A0A4C1UU97_EUMVA|nr:hypothetical protein EVAR_22756_1 [Eumeta japonica]